MGRTVSAAYDAATNTAGVKDVDLLTMIVPKKVGESQDITLRFATDQTITIGANVYECRINSFPQAIKHSLGQSPDGGDVALSNFDNVLGIILGDPDRDVDKTYVLASRAYVVSAPSLPEIWEADPYFGGYMRAPRIGREVRFQLISDMYRRGGQIGGVSIPQRCRFVFNVNGVHPLGASCGWQVSQGGDPLVCAHTEDDCVAHNNRHRYGGVGSLKAVQRDVIGATNPADDPYGNGFPPNVTPRPHPYLDFDNPLIRRAMDLL